MKMFSGIFKVMRAIESFDGGQTDEQSDYYTCIDIILLCVVLIFLKCL